MSILDVKNLKPNKSGPKGHFMWRVNLPPEWIKKQGLENGGSLLISEDGNRLVIERQIS